MSAHASPQSDCVPQLGTHCLFVQATVPPVGVTHFLHESPHASAVSPAHAGAPDVPVPLSPVPEPASSVGPPDEAVPELTAASSPTQAPRATKPRNKPVVIPWRERILRSYH